MPNIIIYEPGGLGHVIQAPVGHTVMEVALQNNVAGIVADCGGSCSCATCHVQVDPAWIERTGRAGAMESDLLEFAEGVTDLSRLSCQIQLREDHEGLILRVPGD
ncbi:2Fe-2S iron-sulfur cluster-binding protein [Sphingosinicella terrae]|jgi:ferredoxin, 2Fe-2S|uniref:2Fe-2S iron-sulfur cluster-binding protein n=1 Tax=Sphingosinicella terrae TaxID=2172047 RepID=UPI000E0DD0E1|nr:2Fe-2S iron-sulfur cluster-binding protein [Sphingosinicella terrae]